MLVDEPVVTTTDSAARTDTGKEILRLLPGWRKSSKTPSGFQDCSLVIPTFNRPSEVSGLIRAIAALPDIPAEVVVVDGSGDDDTGVQLISTARKTALPFDLVYVKSPAGLTLQRNVGIDISSGEFIFFLDDDCVPEPGYFRELRLVFINDGGGKIGGAGGILVNEIQDRLSLRWRLRLALRLVPRIKPGIYHPSGTSVPRALLKSIDPLRRVDMLSGCSMVFRRDVLERNRFSLFFSGYSQGEDLEMSLRVRREWDIVWVGAARAFHHHAVGGRPASFAKGRMEVRNRYFIWKRNSSDAMLRDKARFWLDMFFLMAVDVATWLRHPTAFYHLSHASGLAGGVFGCVTAPPQYEEPEAHREYELDEQDLSS